MTEEELEKEALEQAAITAKTVGQIKDIFQFMRVGSHYSRTIPWYVRDQDELSCSAAFPFYNTPKEVEMVRMNNGFVYRVKFGRVLRSDYEADNPGYKTIGMDGIDEGGTSCGELCEVAFMVSKELIADVVCKTMGLGLWHGECLLRECQIRVNDELNFVVEASGDSYWQNPKLLNRPNKGIKLWCEVLDHTLDTGFVTVCDTFEAVSKFLGDARKKAD